MSKGRGRRDTDDRTIALFDYQDDSGSVLTRRDFEDGCDSTFGCPLNRNMTEHRNRILRPYAVKQGWCGRNVNGVIDLAHRGSTGPIGHTFGEKESALVIESFASRYLSDYTVKPRRWIDSGEDDYVPDSFGAENMRNQCFP